QHQTSTEHEIDLGGGHLPRTLCSHGVEVTHQAPVLVVDGDRSAQLIIGDRLAAQFPEVVHQLGELVDVVIAADVVPVVLRHIEITDVDIREHRLPHAGQIADNVTDRREQHAVDEIEPARYAEFDGRARNAANVALVVGVAVDDFELVAAAEDTERQEAGSVNELA